MSRPLRLRIKRLGPLRDTEAVFGDLTVVVGNPNTGKSYLLKALYEVLAPGDPWGLASCVTEHLSQPDLDKLLHVRIWQPGTMGGLFNAEICLHYEALTAIISDRIRECFASSLLPPHSVEAEPRQSGLQRLREAVRRAAVETLLETYGGNPVAAGDGAVCVKVEGVRPPRRMSLTPWLRWREGRQRNFKEIKEDLMFMMRMRFPWRLLISRCLAYATSARVVYAAYGRSVAAQILLHSSLPESMPYEAGLIREILGGRSLPFLSLYESIARGYKGLLRGERVAVEMLEIFKPLLMGKLRVEPGELVYEFNGDGVPLKFASALAAEASAFMLAAAGLALDNAEERWLLIEEPESQLHPSMQAVAAAVVLHLASTGTRIVATTHSDLFAVTLLELVRAARIGRLREALHDLAGRLGVSMPMLEEEGLKQLDVRVLYTRRRVDGEGYEVAQLDLGEALTRLPGLSDVMLEVARWSLWQLMA